MCIDSHVINKITISVSFNYLEDMLSQMDGTQWFSRIDWCCGYHQNCIRSGTKWMIAFKTKQSLQVNNCALWIIKYTKHIMRILN